MKNSFDYEAFATLLEKETEVQHGLLVAARAMRDAVKRADVPAVKGFTEIFDSLSGSMEELEIKRVKLCREFALEVFGKEVTVKIAAIESNAGPLREKISALGKVLKTGVGELVRLATELSILLEENVGFIGNTVRSMCTRPNNLGNYGAFGGIDKTPLRMNFVNQVV